LRSRARQYGLVRLLRSIAGSSHAHPEEAFQRALQASIRPGDTVWDIGANVGHYTFQFFQWTSPAGKVVAFEPLPEAFGALQVSLRQLPDAENRCQLHQVALTDQDGEVPFATRPVSGKGVSTVAHIVDSAQGSSGPIVRIPAFRVDSMIEKTSAPFPQVTKIDVEGYEEEVLSGGHSTFSSPNHRELFIEIHFARLTERAKDNAPARIVSQLKDWGYKIQWLDASHLWASRSRDMAGHHPHS